MAKPLELQSLTFEVDGPKITAHDFNRSFSAFLELANEVANDIAGRSRAIEWILSVEAGSVRVQVTPEAVHIDPKQIPTAINAIRDGLEFLEAGKHDWPDHFSEKALANVRHMSRVVSSSKEELSIQIKYNGSTTKLSSQSIASIDRLLKGKYTDYGTIEGYIRIISKKGGAHFFIDDDVSDRKNIRCYFKREFWNDVIQSFDPEIDRRVSVTGDILYRRDGVPVHISVEEFRILRKKEELPTWDDVIGIYADK